MNTYFDINLKPEDIFIVIQGFFDGYSPAIWHIKSLINEDYKTSVRSFYLAESILKNTVDILSDELQNELLIYSENIIILLENEDENLL